MSLPDSLLGLLDTDTYPHACRNIELIETHISWVLLTGEYAYKLKKPVQFSFLDFSTLALREHFCREELRCNRAFAPELYVDVVAIYRHKEDSLRVGSDGANGDELLEWAVKMRQFEPAKQLDRLLEQDAVTTDMMMRFGQELAACHAALPQLKTKTAEIEKRVFKPAEDNFTEIATTGLQPAHAALLTRTAEASAALGQRLRPLLTQRMLESRIRECHGDLHLSNLAVIDGKVTAFDCLEFNAELRWIDTISDVAFLFMDCHERGRSDLAYACLDGYLDVCGDYEGILLLGYYAAYRSMVRAKVAALRWEQDRSASAEARFVAHTEWAEQWLRRSPGTLLLMCGLSGAGKSYVAQRLVPLLPAVRLRSDVARKALAGLETQARTNSTIGGGLYAPKRSQQVYAHIAQLAKALLTSGDNVIVDATFIEHQQRDVFLSLAKELGVKAWVIYCNAPVEILQQRIQARFSEGRDASEATPEVLDMQLDKFEPPCPPEPTIELATGVEIDSDALRSLVAEVAS